jgi:hypothetical protein
MKVIEVCSEYLFDSGLLSQLKDLVKHYVYKRYTAKAWHTMQNTSLPVKRIKRAVRRFLIKKVHEILVWVLPHHDGHKAENN